MHFDDDDNRFYKRHVIFRKADTLEHVMARRSPSADEVEDALIDMLDGTPEDDAEPPLPLSFSPGAVDEDLLWMWRCRESGLGWREIAPMLGLKTAAGAWKRFHKLLRAERKKWGR